MTTAASETAQACNESEEFGKIRNLRLIWTPFIVTTVILGLALRLVFIILTPVGGPSVPGRLSAYNDEAAHTNYVLHILRTGKLPAQVESIQEPGALARAEFENYQPPLFYWGTAVLCKVLGVDTVEQVTYTGRIICLFIWFGLCYVMLRISIVLALNRFAVDAIVACLALNGVFVRYTTTLSNDALFWFFAGCCIWLAVSVGKREKHRYESLVFVALSVLGLFTKATFLLLIPLAFFVADHRDKAKFFAQSFAIFAVIAALTLPVWFRNIREFGGWLPLSAGFGMPVWQFPSLSSVSFAARSLVFPWSEFWRGYVGLLLFLPAFALLLWSFLIECRSRRFERQPALVAALVLSSAGFLWLNLRYYQAEARYLFTAWPALCVGFSCFPSSAYRWTLAAALLLPYGLFLFR